MDPEAISPDVAPHVKGVNCAMVEDVALEDIMTMVAVAESGSVSAAAERLSLAQPVVTRRIQRLEAALGVDLLDRSVRPSRLTAAGRWVLGPCRDILAALDDLRAITTEPAPAGELRLGMAPALADLAFSAALGELRERYPRVVLRVHTDWTPQLLHQLRAGVLDMAVVQLPVDAHAPEGLAAQALGIEPLIVVVAPGLGLAAEADLATLVPLPWVLSPPGDGGRLLLEAAFRRLQAPLQVVAEIQGHELQAALVARGVGAGLLPARLLRQHEASFLFRPVRLLDEAFAIRIWAARNQGSRHLAAPLALLDNLLGQAIARGLGDDRSDINPASAR